MQTYSIKLIVKIYISYIIMYYFCKFYTVSKYTIFETQIESIHQIFFVLLTEIHYQHPIAT